MGRKEPLAVFNVRGLVSGRRGRVRWVEFIDHAREATARLDVDALVSTMHPDVTFHAPVVGRIVFAGREDVETFFRAAFSIFDDVVCRSEMVGDAGVVLILDCRFGRLAFTDALLVELDGDGLVRAFTPHLRPWFSSTVFMVRVAARLSRRPGLLVRSLRAQGAE